MLSTVIKAGRHDVGWPRFSLVVTAASSDQTHRLYVSVQGGVDSHDARGPAWEVAQYRPLPKICSEPMQVHGTSHERRSQAPARSRV